MKDIFDGGSVVVQQGDFKFTLKNKTFSLSDFCYISYNSCTSDYGTDTTAIVLSNWNTFEDFQRNNKHTFFLILKGKHEKLVDMTVLEALEYYSRSGCKLENHSDLVRDFLLNISFFNPMFRKKL